MPTPPHPVSVPAPALTFAIPFYQGRALLQRAIASVLHQKDPSWQLLVCDDCGPEPGTAELVRSYADPRIRYHRNERNLGMAGNWNRCLDLAATDLVNLLHADDELLDNYAGLMLGAAQQYPHAAAFFCRARIIDEHSRPCFSFPDFVKRFLLPRSGGTLRLRGRRAVEALLRGDFIMCPTVCYRKSVLRSRRFSFAWKQVQDLEFFIRLLLDGDLLVGLPEVAYAYRRHPGNATSAHTHSLLRFEEESRLYDELRQAAACRGWPRAARLAARKGIIRLNLLYCVAADLLRLQGSQAWRKLSFLRRLHRRLSPGTGSRLPQVPPGCHTAPPILQGRV
jgi:glycosyltransferase involved in cell wall biosynthesis